MTEWTIYGIGNQHYPHYIQLSSIQQFNNKASAKVKELVDPTQPKTFLGKSFPEAAYIEEVNVYDCIWPVVALAEVDIFNQSGKLIYHYKWADPQYVNLSIGISLSRGSVGLTARNIACHGETAIPLVSKRQLEEMKFRLLSSMVLGDGDIFFSLNGGDQQSKDLTFIIRSNADRSVQLPPGTSIPDPPQFRFEVDRLVRTNFALVKANIGTPPDS